MPGSTEKGYLVLHVTLNEYVAFRMCLIFLGRGTWVAYIILDQINQRGATTADN